MPHPIKRLVPLEEDEWLFLMYKLKKERRLFWRTLIGLSLIGVAIPMIMLLFLRLMPHENEVERAFREENFPDYFFVVVAVFLIFLIAFAGYYGYRKALGRIVKDTKEKKKIIERTKISKKVFMPHNKTFHFYIESEKKNSIEVQVTDFQFYKEGDEINIEYSQYAEEYFGYY